MNTLFRPEHPEPQFERENWVNLNGEWEFEIDFSSSGVDRRFFEREHFDSKIIVPFCPESKLSGIGYTDFMNSVWYKTEINISKVFPNGRVILHFGAVDYLATVYVNGKKAGSHKGGYTSFKIDITDFVSDGINTVVVNAADDLRSGNQPCGKQCKLYDSQAFEYTRTTGIWQTVWLEYVPENYIKQVKYFPEPESASLTVQAIVCGKGIFVAEAFYGGRKVGEKAVSTNGGSVTFTLGLSEKHLWEIGEGRLYDLKLRFGEDEVKSYFGLRSVCIDKLKFLLNGKSVFQRLVLDQGFYPDGIYTAKDEDELTRDIDLSLQMGFNGARPHQKVFESRYLYHCDKKGYLIWGEYANFGLVHPRAEAIYAVLPEWLEAVERDFNHPSIIGWCPFNETWDIEGMRQRDELISTVYYATKALDKTRPCIDVSGFFHVVTDIFDLHDYYRETEEFKKHFEHIVPGEAIKNSLEYHPVFNGRQIYGGEPVFVSEYGGLKIEKDSLHTVYGYHPETEEEFYERYRGLTHALLDNEKIMGFCYTQLYDIEQEQNGLYTYFRVPKVNAEKIYEINTKIAAIEK